MGAAPIPMLLYHSVAADCDPRFAEWAISPDLFREHMACLASGGYRTLTVSELVEQVHVGGRSPDPGCVVVTFDDGFEDFHRHAWPALREQGLKATVFVTTGHVGGTSAWLARLGEGNRPMLSWDQIGELAAAGIECGAHGHEHLQLDTVEAQRAWQDMVRSRRALADVVGPVAAFAYPHGYHTARVRRQVASAGFECACAVRHAMCTAADDRFALSRIVVRGDTAVDALERMLHGQEVPASGRGGRSRAAAWRAVRRAGVQELPRRPTRRRRPAADRHLAAIGPATHDAWRELLDADDEALVPQSPEWIEALCADGRYEDASRLYETRAGGRLLLPLVRRRGRWPLRSAPAASMPPSWGMGGLLAAPAATAADVAAIVADLGRSPAVRTAIRPNPLHGDLWGAAAGGPGTVAVPRRAHVLDLYGGPEAVYRRFTKKGRAGVRKAEAAGVEVQSAPGAQLLPEFCALQELSVARWARAQHEPLALARWRARRRDPPEKFQRIASALGDAMRIWVAYREGRPAAAIIVLTGRNASDTRGAMDRERVGTSHANYLLQWHAIQDACAAGCRRWHMGETGGSRTLAHYKQQFGARSVAYPEVRIERLPLTRADAAARGLVKRAIGFRDA